MQGPHYALPEDDGHGQGDHARSRSCGGYRRGGGHRHRRVRWHRAAAGHNEDVAAVIERVTARLGRRGALLLFPEGGNYTPERKRSTLRRLWLKGRRRSVAKAEQMPHLLPPQPTGALAALRANPHADVVFAAHTGLGLAAYPPDIWRDMPIGRALHTRMWLVRAQDVPDSPDDQITWLYDWWKRIDDWIDRQSHDEQVPAETRR